MRLLLAEDEVELSRALVTILKHNNYSVDAVYNGEDALEYLKSEIYDGAIFDIMMPKMNGLEVLRAIRAEGNAIPVLLLTAKSEIDDKVAGLDSGADDYLAKPFAVKELLARIRAMLRRKTEAVDVVLRYGNVSLNLSTFELIGEKGKFRLANKEFQIMEILLSNPESITSSERLMEKIWGYDSETEQNVVWVYLSYLRKKLMSIGANIQIKAFRNLGYSLEMIDK